MSLNDLVRMLGNACYGFLALNFLWGLYNVIMGFRRVKELNFGDHDEQALDDPRVGTHLTRLRKLGHAHLRGRRYPTPHAAGLGGRGEHRTCVKSSSRP